MAIEQRNYDPAIMYGAQLNITVDLGDLLDANENELLEFDAVASAVNYIRIANAATGNRPVLSIQGEVDIGLEFHAADGEQLLILVATAAAVNEVTITSQATGVAPSVAATGGDTNIDLALITAGTGGVLFDVASEIVTGTNVLTAAESGKVCFLNASAEFDSTLPAVAQGLHFKFVVSAAPSGVDYQVLTNSGDNVIEGSVTVAGAVVLAANEDEINFVQAAAIVGDWVELVCDGTSWFVSGQASASGAVTFVAT